MTPSLAELIASKTWRVVIAREGVTLNRHAFLAGSLQQLAAMLGGTPVGKYPTLSHADPARVREAGGPLNGHTVGQVVDPVYIEGFGVTATIRLTESQDELQRDLLTAHFTGHLSEWGLSLVAASTEEDGVVYGPNAWGNRVSEGLARVVTRIGRVYAVDIVRESYAGGRFVLPSALQRYGYTGHTGRALAR